MEYYSAKKKRETEWNNAICCNMYGPRDDHTKWSKSDRERQTSDDISYMQNLKYYTKELIYKTETDTYIENKLMVTKGERGEGGINKEFGISRYKLQYYI